MISLCTAFLKKLFIFLDYRSSSRRFDNLFICVLLSVLTGDCLSVYIATTYTSYMPNTHVIPVPPVHEYSVTVI